jgi:hypothetical protein
MFSFSLPLGKWRLWRQVCEEEKWGAAVYSIYSVKGGGESEVRGISELGGQEPLLSNTF